MFVCLGLLSSSHSIQNQGHLRLVTAVRGPDQDWFPIRVVPVSRLNLRDHVKTFCWVRCVRRLIASLGFQRFTYRYRYYKYYLLYVFIFLNTNIVSR
jgi:hypothetical protein